MLIGVNFNLKNLIWYISGSGEMLHSMQKLLPALLYIIFVSIKSTLSLPQGTIDYSAYNKEGEEIIKFVVVLDNIFVNRCFQSNKVVRLSVKC